MWVVDDEAMGLFKRARACLEKSVDLGRKAQRAVPVAFDGAFLPSTVGLAIVDGAYRGLPFLASP